DDHPRALVEELAGRREHALAAADLEERNAQERLELLERVRHRRLALVEGPRSLRMAARFDDGDEGPPLFERDDRGVGHIDALDRYAPKRVLFYRPRPPNIGKRRQKKKAESRRNQCATPFRPSFRS